MGGCASALIHFNQKNRQSKEVTEIPHITVKKSATLSDEKRDQISNDENAHNTDRISVIATSEYEKPSKF